jgi:hypothetical protein
MKRKAMFLLTARWQQLGILAALTLLHGILTVVGLLSYVQTALTASHGGQISGWTTFCQHLKSLFLWPLLLPLLKNWPLILRGLPGSFLVLINSAVWIVTGWWVYSYLHKRGT